MGMLFFMVIRYMTHRDARVIVCGTPAEPQGRVRLVLAADHAGYGADSMHFA